MLEFQNNHSKLLHKLLLLSIEPNLVKKATAECGLVQHRNKIPFNYDLYFPIQLIFYIPKTIPGLISNLILITRATFNVGSLFPVRYSLILDGLTPIISDNFVCVRFISYIRTTIIEIIGF